MSKTRQVVLHKAYLLHSRPYRDSSVLLDLLSEEYGHVSAIAYVGKSKKSNKKGLLQPFSCLDVELKGNSSLKTLSQVQQAQKSLPLTGHYLFSGFYMNELLVRLLPENIPCENLFNLYQNALLLLNKHQPIEPVLRRFEMSLLEELGMSLDFSVLTQYEHDFICANDQMSDTEEDLNNHHSSNNKQFQLEGLYREMWQFIPEFGFVKAEIGVNYPLYVFADLQQIGLGEFNEPHILLTFKRLMRQVLQRYLGNKPLHSRKLFSNRLAK